jgi:hypothetical protein
MMINILSSDAESPSSLFKETERHAKENNIQWLRRMNLDWNQTVLVMVGGKSLMDFRLRVAQSHVRSDLTPSHWSHVMLLGSSENDLALPEVNEENLNAAKVTEISLEPPRGFQFPTPNNGVQEGDLKRYSDIDNYPNIAVLEVPVSREKVAAAIKRFKMQRAVLDGVDLIIRWLAFVWGVARSSNPLMDGMGIPSAAMLEIVIGAVDFDLTPGLESRSSCPEAISQAAKYWHEYYLDQKKPALSGFYWVEHDLLKAEGKGKEASPNSKRSKGSANKTNQP